MSAALPIRQYVRTDLVTDQRVHKWALSLQQLGFAVETVGEGSHPPTQRPYPTRLLPRSSHWLGWQQDVYRDAMRQPPALLLAHDLDTLPALYHVSRQRKLPLLLDAHEYWSQQHQYRQRHAQRWGWALLERWYLPRLGLGSTVSRPIQEAFQRRFGWETVLLPNYPLAQVPPATSTEARRALRTVIYQGQLVEGRGLELLLRALVLLPDVRLLILGGGPLLDWLRQAADRLGIGGRTVLPGKVPFDQLPGWTARASLGVSMEWGAGANVRWSAPNKLYDYAQAHLPVIVSDLPVHAAHVQQYGCGLVLRERTPEALAGLIRQLLDDPKAYGQAAQGAALASTVCTWDAQLPVIQHLVRTALTNSRGQAQGLFPG